MQRKQRFIADQRYDLPQHDSMLRYIDQEFYTYNKRFFSPNNRVVKNWRIVNNGGLQVKVDQTADSLLFNTERTDHESIILRNITDDALTVTLADNAVNYVEVRMTTEFCAQDTVAIWDQTANGGNGEEFTQSSLTAVEEKPALQTNAIAFTGDPDRLPLAIVTTAGGVITNITDAREFLFHVDTYWNFGSPRTDKGISNLLEAYQALATSIKEIKGTTDWFDVSWPSVRTLKEFQNLFFTDGGDIGFEGTFGAGNLGWSAAINIRIADRTNFYTIAAATVAVPEGSAVYVTIPENDVSSPPLAPVVVPLSAVPIDPASVGYVPGIQVLFYRINNQIYGMMDIPELSSGEVVVIGQNLSTQNQNRLGLTSDTAFQAYTSTSVILTTDNYATAISKLDAALAGVLSDLAKEDHFLVGVGGQTVFTLPTIVMNVADSIPDIQVTVNGQKVRLSPTGLIANGDFKKNSTTQIEFFALIPENAEVIVRDERTGGGSGNDLTNITVDPQPVANGSRALGTVAKGWSGLFLKDTTSAQVYRIDMVSGVLTMTAVP